MLLEVGDNYHYLASPYTHPEERVMEERYQMVMAAAAFLMNQGRAVFSPILHCHEMAKRFNLPRDFVFWDRYDKIMLLNCGDMVVLTIDGVFESRGVASEIEVCRRNSVPITKMIPISGGQYHFDEWR